MTIDLKIRLDFETTPPPPSPPKYIGWRVKHKVEGGSQNTPPGMPEVTPPLNSNPLKMTSSIQWLSYNLMTAMNPLVTKRNWTKVHDYNRAFTNNNGFSDPNDPRINYVTGENIGAPLPKYDKAQRVCGGSFVRGEAVGDKLICRSGLHTIHPSFIPSIQEVIEKQLYIYAVSIGASNESIISHFPQGSGGPVVIPFICENDIEFPIAYFERWEADTLPDPLKVYL